MLKRFGNIVLAVALLLSTGMHWVMLQSIAWMGMVVTYSQKAPLMVALRDTFDGQHPCCLCKAIAAARKSEKKKDFTLQTKKLEFPPAPKNVVLVAPADFQLLPMANNVFAKALTQKPLLPPPRACLA